LNEKHLKNRLKQIWKVGALYRIKEEAELNKLALREAENHSQLISIDAKDDPFIHLSFQNGQVSTMTARKAKEMLYIDLMD